MSKKILVVLAALVFTAQACNPFARSSTAGIIKTVNGGADWQFSNAIKDNRNSSLNGVSVSSLAFDPTRRETLYAGSYTEGLYKSEDSGASWTRILSKILVYDFAIHPQDSKRIYAAGYYGGFGKVLVTVDGGASWEEVYNEESTENPVRAIALNPANPQHLVIGTSSGSVLRSTDSGQNWTLVTNLDDRINRIFWRSGSIFVLMRAKGLYVAPEGSSQFQDFTHNLTATANFDAMRLEERVTNFSQMFIDPSNPSIIYLTTQRGLYKTYDGGRSWQYVTLPVRPESAYARAVAVAQSSSNVVYTSVGSTVYKSTDGGLSWQTQKIPTDGFVNYLLVDPALPQITYGGVYSQ